MSLPELGLGVLLVTVALVIFFKDREHTGWGSKATLTVMIVLAFAAYGLGIAPGMIEAHERQQRLDAQQQAQYNKAMMWKDTGYYTEAIKVLTQMANGTNLYQAEIVECENLAAYDRAEKLLDAGAYEQAEEAFLALGAFQDSQEKSEQCAQILYEPIYQEAAEAAAQGHYAEAYRLYAGIRDYRDVAQLLQSEEMQQGRTQYYQPGTKFTFGAYGNNEITWLILKVEDNRALIVSEDILEFEPYEYENKSSFWRTSFIRTWLNETFLREAFDEDELTCIYDTDVIPWLSVPVMPGNEAEASAVIDKIFLLSSKEAELYFQNDAARVAYMTYAGSVPESIGVCARRAPNRGISVSSTTTAATNTRCRWMPSMASDRRCGLN